MSTPHAELDAPAPLRSAPPRPALFLDRDGVINEDAGYLHRPEDIRFLPGIFPLVSAANAAGMPVIVVTNQSGIGRGYFQEKDFHALMDWMGEECMARGCRLDAVYFCPHHPVHGLGAYKTSCTCRKPAPGMFTTAARELHIALPRSVMVGDSLRDMQAAVAAGVGCPLWLAPPATPLTAPTHASVQTVRSLAEVLRFLPR